MLALSCTQLLDRSWSTLTRGGVHFQVIELGHFVRSLLLAQEQMVAISANGASGSCPSCLQTEGDGSLVAPSIKGIPYVSDDQSCLTVRFYKGSRAYCELDMICPEGVLAAFSLAFSRAYAFIRPPKGDHDLDNEERPKTLTVFCLVGFSCPYIATQPLIDLIDGPPRWVFLGMQYMSNLSIFCKCPHCVSARAHLSVLFSQKLSETDLLASKFALCEMAPVITHAHSCENLRLLCFDPDVWLQEAILSESSAYSHKGQTRLSLGWQEAQFNEEDLLAVPHLTPVSGRVPVLNSPKKRLARWRLFSASSTQYKLRCAPVRVPRLHSGILCPPQ